VPIHCKGGIVNLGKKFSGAILLLLAAVLGATAVFLIGHQRAAMLQGLQARAHSVLCFGEACRDYARQVLSPAVHKAFPGPDAPLIFEADSATFVARGTFDFLRQRLPDYSFREAALNPLNPANQADPTERALVERFQQETGLEEVSGFRERDGREEFFVARPIRVRKECLACHHSPETAPPELVERYGTDHGYGWQEGEVAAALIVAVPAEDIQARQTAIVWKVFTILGGVAVLLVVLIHLLFARLVNRRLRHASTVMEQVARDPLADVRLPTTPGDELGELSATFNVMADSLRDSHRSLEKRVEERTAELTRVNRNLEAVQILQAENALQLAHSLEQLQKNEARTRMILGTALDGIVIMDAEGRITEFNPAAEKNFGFSRSEVINRPLAELIIPPAFRQQHRESVAHYLATGEGRLVGKRIETSALRADGTEFPVELALMVLPGENGCPPQFAAFVRDITERRRAEEDLKRAKEAAEAASVAKSEFLANMSHEIRTPMNGVLGMLDLSLDTSLTPEQREYLQMAKLSADSLLTVVNDILDFSKIEAGKLDLEPIDFCLRDGLEDTLKTFSPRAHAKGLELACQVAPEVPDLVRGDLIRLRQILVNLIGNALKFTERGEIVVSVSVDQKSGAPETPTENPSDASFCALRFSVRDTGIGIPAEKLQQIFAPFTQADSSTTRKYGGTGLGLTITSRLVGMMGGRIWAESVVGQGSTFHFTARLELQKVNPSSLLPRRSVSLKGLPVLVVDDNATNRRILSEVLQNWSMKPTLADNGWTALNLLEEAAARGQPFSLVLLDVCMPEMDGFEVAARIREHSDLAGSTLLMLSSSDRNADIARCRELGVETYLTKPIKQSELMEAITRLLESRPPDQGPAPRREPEKPRPGRALRVLVAEDHVVNQRLAARILEKMGHEPVLVANGQEAVRRFEQEQFDLVLMDVQMPVMGGFEATAYIREIQARTGRQVPILALTARALVGDKEECLKAGMDGYLSKPINARQLREAMDDVLGLSERALVQTPPPGAGSSVFDRQAVLARIGGDEDLLNELIGLFLGDAPRQLGLVLEAAAAGDARALRVAAHTLKGTASNLAATEATLAAQRLERMGQTGDLEGLEEATTRLQRAMIRLLEELHRVFGGILEVPLPR
jgi:PAS domain S-box-containing protein